MTAASVDRAWLEGVLASVRPSLDRGLGVCGVFYDLSDPGAPSMKEPMFLGAPAGAAEAFAAMVDNAPPGLFASLLRSIPSCATLSDRLAAIGLDLRAEPLAANVLAPLGVRDFVSIAATDASGAGCLVGAPLPAITSAAGADRDGWLEVGALVMAKMRQRLVVARRGAVGTSAAPPRAPLSRREQEILERAARGESNKRIALELGLAPSTVAGHLTNAADKLGAKSRVELVTTFARSR